MLVVVLADAPILRLFTAGGVAKKPRSSSSSASTTTPPSSPSIPAELFTDAGVVAAVAGGTESAVAPPPSSTDSSSAPAEATEKEKEREKEGSDGSLATSGVAIDCDNASANTAARMLHDEVHYFTQWQPTKLSLFLCNSIPLW